MSMLCYAARFLRPFGEALSTYERDGVRSLLDELDTFDPAGRIPIAVGNDLALRHVAAVDDPDLGLRAAQLTPTGGAGALEYAMNSAATMREALDIGARFCRIYCDTLRVSVETDRTRVTVRLHSSLPSPRVVSDYAMASWYARHTRIGLGEGARLECHFGHSKPASTREYDRVYGHATLHFDAPWYGFGFDRDDLDRPLPGADRALHLVLCDYASRELAHLEDRPSLVDKVRELARREIADGNPTVSAAARALHMSSRTLASRLEREGTTFSTLLDTTRRELALRYVEDLRLSLGEVSSRVGFSHFEGFHRAFKRWTGETPASYRRTRRDALP